MPSIHESFLSFDLLCYSGARCLDGIFTSLRDDLTVGYRYLPITYCMPKLVQLTTTDTVKVHSETYFSVNLHVLTRLKSSQPIMTIRCSRVKSKQLLFQLLWQLRDGTGLLRNLRELQFGMIYGPAWGSVPRIEDVCELYDSGAVYQVRENTTILLRGA